MEPTFKFIFFGSSDISVMALEALKRENLLPVAVVTQPDKPKGRGLEIFESPVKTWAKEKNIPVLENLESDTLKNFQASVAVLVSYGKIIPQAVIDIFPKGIVNLHPSLLPKLRGPSPIESTILLDMKEEAGVSIMLIDQKMDHGPILAQEKIALPEWPLGRKELLKILGETGGKILAKTLPLWMSGEITPVEQDDSMATYCKMIKKEDALLNLTSEPYKNFLKIKAYEEWPVAYTFIKNADREIRVKITEADFKDGALIIKKVIPEGKKEMEYESFLKGLRP